MQQARQRFLISYHSPVFQAICLAAAYTFIASLISLSKHWSYNTYAFDLGIFSQSLWHTLHGDILYNSPEGMSHFGYHFQPILLLLVPIFWLAPYSETLLLVQSIALGASGYLVYKLARIQHLEHKTSLLIEGLFFLSPLLHGVNFFDFHPVALAVPTLLIMIIGLVKHRWTVFTIGLILSLGTKEDVIAVLGVFSAVMLLAQYLSHRRVERVYLVIFLASCATYTLAVFLAKETSGLDPPPMLMLGEFRYSYINESLGSAITGALGCFFNWQSIFLLFSYFLPLCFLPLFSPLWVAPVIFIVCKDMLASAYWQKVLHQYPAPAIPFLFTALIYTLKQGEGMKSRYSPLLKRIRRVLPVVAIVMAVLINLHPASVFREMGLPHQHEKAINTVTCLIPDGATVTVPRQIFPHLCTRTFTYLPYEWNEPNKVTGDYGLQEVETEYVILDLRHMENYHIGCREENINWADYIEGKYGLIASIDGVSLLRRGYNGTPIITGLNTTSGLNVTIYGDEAFHNEVIETQLFLPIQGDFTSGSIIPGIVPDDEWSMYLSGYIYASGSGVHQFHLNCDGNALLVVDDQYTLCGYGIRPYLTHLKLDLDKGFHKIELYYTKYHKMGRMLLDLETSRLYQSLPKGTTLANSQLVVDKGWGETKIDISGERIERTVITKSPLQLGSILIDFTQYPLLEDSFIINTITKAELTKDSEIRFQAYVDEYLVIKVDDSATFEIAPYSAVESEISLSAGEHTVEMQFNKPKGKGLLHLEWFLIPY